MRYKAVLLDADETVFDFCRSEQTAFHEAAAVFGIRSTDHHYEIYHACNQALWKALERGEVTRDRLRTLRFEHWSERTGIRVDSAALNQVYAGRLAAGHHMLPGAMEFLRELSARCAVYLTTNGTADVQHRRIADAGIRPYLQEVFISEELGASKPEKAYYDRVFSVIPYTPGECIAFGDSLTSDIAGAVGAGVDSCWYNPARAPLSGEIRPTYIAADYAQFLSLLGIQKE